MATVTNEQFVLAKVYSNSMLELAAKSGEVESLHEELQALGRLLEKDQALARFFTNPTVDARSRTDAIEQTFRGRASDLLVNSLQVLNRKDRLVLLPAVIQTYRAAVQAHAGRMEATVISAIPLGEEAKTILCRMIGKHCGKEIDLVEKVDESLMGGLVVEMGDEKLDASVAQRLERLGEALRDRSLRELHSAPS
ncbi:MAG: ATP synthase F1 subunit delta [Phycisphaerae bacterium]